MICSPTGSRHALLLLSFGLLIGPIAFAAAPEDIDTLLAAGMNHAALESLQDLEREAPPGYATHLRQARALRGMGRADDAAQHLDAAAELANNGVDVALILHEQAVLLAESGNLPDARARLAEAVDVFREEQRDLFALRAELDGVRLQMADFDLAGLAQSLRNLADQTQTVAGTAGIEVNLAVGSLIARCAAEFDCPPALRLTAYHRLQTALSIARAAADRRAQSYVLGTLATLYQQEDRDLQALQLSAQAAALADLPEDRYRWEAQLGSAHARLGNLEAAAAAYRRATENLNQVRADLPVEARGGFERSTYPVYRSYADVLLRSAAGTAQTGNTQALLSNARNVLEDLKQAEVEDYFARQCLTTRSTTGWSAPAERSAIVYPVMLDDRLEILLEYAGQLQRFSSPVARLRLEQAVRDLRLELESLASGQQYLRTSQLLYNWLIAPLEQTLRENNIDTLVVVPEGSLRTIPLAALHDGTGFLVEKYALATTPAMRFTRRATAQPLAPRALLAGLTEGVQGFAPLPNVAEEISDVAAMFPGQVYRDQSFRLDAVTADIAAGGYGIAHFATHGQFKSDHSESFLLTFDGRLTMARLESALSERQQATNQPLDLLVLSACQTAAGDDRAALGLAGIAIQSGANSALASLWSISDQATARLIGDFYANLAGSGLQKARSLQAAQVALLRSAEFSHPSYWSPYLLIGSWN